jgi:hypothetical protein
MFENRISGLYRSSAPPDETLGRYVAPAAQLFPMASIEDVYQAAQTRARNEYELDKLFNPEYYGDHGSGI